MFRRNDESSFRGAAARATKRDRFRAVEKVKLDADDASQSQEAVVNLMVMVESERIVHRQVSSWTAIFSKL